MTGPMIIKVQHAQITIAVGTEEKAREFYRETLGFTEVPRPQALQGRGGFWLEIGGFQVHVGTDDGFDRTSTKAHLAYEVESLGYWRKRLQACHIEILEGLPIPNFNRFEFRDPFGNRVEFLERTEK